MELYGAVAIVTGASRGIGRGVAEALLARGVKVTIGDIDISAGEATRDELCNKFGPNAVTFAQCDVTKTSDLQNLYKACKTAYGRVNILVNNAGILDEVNWKKMVDINFTAVVNNTLLGMEELTDISGQPGGNVVNIGSIAGLHPDLLPTISKYSATKCGVVGFTRAMAAQAKSGLTKVKFNSINPCWVNTYITKNFADVFSGTFSGEEKTLVYEDVTYPVMETSRIGEAVIEVLDKECNGAHVAIVANQPFKYFEFESLTL